WPGKAAVVVNSTCPALDLLLAPRRPLRQVAFSQRSSYAPRPVKSDVERGEQGMRKLIALPVAAVATVGLAVGTAAAGTPFSFGVFRDRQLASMSQRLYGVGQPIGSSSTAQVTQAQALADPTRLATLAKGLKARVVTTD